MAISASCVCGKSYRLKDEMAGKRVRCAQCSAVFDVPDPDVETGFEVVDSAAAPARSTASAFRSSAAPAPAPWLSPPDECVPSPPKRKKKRRRRYRDESGGFHISVSPG